jgi:hypothetical protein
LAGYPATKGKNNMRKVLGFLLTVSAVSVPASGLGAEETAQGMLAAQIRTQGFACDKPLGATRDAKRSKPDHAVWVLKCSNATYRVSRAPDMAAQVQPLR